MLKYAEKRYILARTYKLKVVQDKENGFDGVPSNPPKFLSLFAFPQGG